MQRITHTYLATRRGSSIMEIMTVVFILVVISSIFALASHHLIVRAKHTKVMEDQRQIARALNSFGMDHGTYPRTDEGLAALTRGSTYMSSIPDDPFSSDSNGRKYFYFSKPFGNSEVMYVIASVGPDRELDVTKYNDAGFELITNPSGPSMAYIGSAAHKEPQADEIEQFLNAVTYDPTNGLSSGGDILFIAQ